MKARLRLLGLIALISFAISLASIVGTVSLGQNAKPEAKSKSDIEIRIQTDTLQGMKQAYNEAVVAANALAEAKRIGAGKDDCATKLLELNAASKQNAWQAIEVGARYFSSVPVKGYMLDFQKGVYRPEEVKP